jgi:hypothetical protein
VVSVYHCGGTARGRTTVISNENAKRGRAVHLAMFHTLIDGNMRGENYICSSLPESWQHVETMHTLRASTKYTQPGSNWLPSACLADVIATRSSVPLRDMFASAPVNKFLCGVVQRSRQITGCVACELTMCAKSYTGNARMTGSCTTKLFRTWAHAQ